MVGWLVDGWFVRANILLLTSGSIILFMDFVKRLPLSGFVLVTFLLSLFQLSLFAYLFLFFAVRDVSLGRSRGHGLLLASLLVSGLPIVLLGLLLAFSFGGLFVWCILVLCCSSLILVFVRCLVLAGLMRG